MVNMLSVQIFGEDKKVLVPRLGSWVDFVEEKSTSLDAKWYFYMIYESGGKMI
jgi:hypothetical protein